MLQPNRNLNLFSFTYILAYSWQWYANLHSLKLLLDQGKLSLLPKIVKSVYRLSYSVSGNKLIKFARALNVHLIELSFSLLPLKVDELSTDEKST